jgi:hypothetical protein
MKSESIAVTSIVQEPDIDATDDHRAIANP